MKKYWEQFSSSEKKTFWFNLLWFIWAIGSGVWFHYFYLNIKKEYGSNIYDPRIAMEIVHSSDFLWSFFVGVVLILLIFFCLYFDLKMFFVGGDNVVPILILIGLGILNCVISYFSLHYYVLGVIFVGFVAITCTVAFSS